MSLTRRRVRCSDSAGSVRTFLLTAMAMLAFAMNSVFCRLAMGSHSIDAATFTSIRFGSGALVLGAVALLRRPRPALRELGDMRSAFTLFAYAITFSYAYLSLSTGTGALLLFGSAQVTMIGSGLLSGERPGAWEWLGLGSAVFGLVYLVLPGVSAPPLLGALSMLVAGVGWGVYSLRGRRSSDPTLANAGNFLLTVPLLLGTNLLAWKSVHVEPKGVTYAVLSGAVTSGLGYVIWYRALKGLSAIRAATVQLSVPVVAAAIGVLVLHESATLRLGVAGVAVLGGIAVAIGQKSRNPGAPGLR
jgi:drug/metabolite transporter (DMT)-like permease